MKKLEKKSLQHVSNILESFNTYPIHKALIDAMIKAGIDNEVRSEIMDKYQTAISEQIQKVNSAKDWVNILINDVE